MDVTVIISIIIPVYNEEKDIGYAITSLLNQSEKSFEIIVVDDGSTDKTKEIVQKFSKKDKRIKLILGEHKGPGYSRNLGAKIAKGEFLIFVDADMTFDKDYLKNLISPMKKDKDILGTTHDYEIAVNTNNIISNLWGKIRVKEKEGYGNSVIFRAFRKDKFLEFGGFNPKYGYADDQTFFLEKGLKPYTAKNTTCYHKNPETLEETYKQARWIGASWKERFWFFKIPFLKYLALVAYKRLIPFLVLKKAKFNKTKKNFYKVKFYGYFVGIENSIFTNKLVK